MVFTMIAMAVMLSYMATLKSMASARTRIAAVSLANEKMESIRNMPYDSMATVHGPIYPAGTLLDSETLDRNGVSLTIKTVISYVDDPYDGLAGSGGSKDLYPYDYKKVEIIVTKAGQKTEYAKISSLVAAKASETSSSTGIIQLCIVDSNHLPVSDAEVTIQNASVDPVVDIQVTSGVDGCILIPKLPPDNKNDYHLIVTKDGFSTDMTYPRTAQNPHALQPDVNVFVQQITLQTLSIDAVSQMHITVVDDAGVPVANTVVHVEGAKEKWFNPSTKKYSQDSITDANGQISLANMEFDDYTFAVNGWTVIATSPYQPIRLEANTNLPVFITVTHDTAKPIINKCDPISGQTNDDSVSLTATGMNFENGLSIKLINSDGQQIEGKNVLVDTHAGTGTVDAIFDLTAAQIGAWDILITNPDGKSVLQKAGFTVNPSS